MIKINRPALPPDVLRTRGVRRRDTHNRAFQRGVRKFSFADDIYGHPDVKAALIEAQHKKCCFCERVIGEDGDVEHFRPKAGVWQSEDEPIQTPGYYWLAYDWVNLFLACPVCNQRHKKNLFPLADPTKRARSHHDDITQEQPQLIDPTKIDPEEHIGFREEVPYAVKGSPLGKATIAALGLRTQTTLMEQRRDHLARLQANQRVVDLESDLARTAKGRELVSEAREYLRQAILDSAPFASMARAAKKQGFRAPIL